MIARRAVGLGLWTVREGERRLGWGAVVAGVLGGIGAVAVHEVGRGEPRRRGRVVGARRGDAALRDAAVFGALGGIVSERSGVVNIGLEGMMLVGAFFAIYGADLTNGWVGGLLIGMAAGGVFALVHAFFSISLRADQIVSGFAINFLALGLTGYLFLYHYGEQGTPDNLPQVPDVSLPIDSIPFFGRRSTTSTCSCGSRCCWCSLVSAVRVPHAGRAAAAVGRREPARGGDGRHLGLQGALPVVIASGALAAMGGAFLSLGFVHSFTQNMTAGRASSRWRS